MRIVSLQKYRCGFRGVLEKKDCWVFFQVSRRQGPRQLAAYAKADFDGYDHFVGVLGRFMPMNKFLARPVRTPSVSLDALDRLWGEIRAGDPAGASPLYQAATKRLDGNADLPIETGLTNAVDTRIADE